MRGHWLTLMGSEETATARLSSMMAVQAAVCGRPSSSAAARICRTCCCSAAAIEQMPDEQRCRTRLSALAGPTALPPIHLTP